MIITHCWLTVRCWCWLYLWHGRRYCRHIHWSMCSCSCSWHLLMFWWRVTSRLTYRDCCTMLIVTAWYQRLLWCTIRWLNCWRITTMDLGISLNILLYFLVIWRRKSYTVPTSLQVSLPHPRTVWKVSWNDVEWVLVCMDYIYIHAYIHTYIKSIYIAH